MKYLKSLSVAVALFSIGVQYFFVLIRPVGAVDVGSVVISEAYPDPSAGKEYVELVNLSDVPVMLDGLELYDVSSPAPGACENWGKLMSLTGELGAHEYKAFELASARLNNNGDRVALRLTTGEIFDELTYGVCGTVNAEKGFTVGRLIPSISPEIAKLSPTPSGENYLLKIIEIMIDGELKLGALLGFTGVVSAPLERLGSIEWFINNELLHSGELTFEYVVNSAGAYTLTLRIVDLYGNPAQNELEFTIGLPERPDYSAIQLNEVFSSPADGSSEWVELYNTGEASIDLSGVVLDDIANGGSSPYVLPNGTSIMPHAYLVIGKADSKIAFNNSGDDVRLVLPSGDLIQAITYSAVETGLSYTLYEGEWVLSDQPTPGEPNLPMHVEESVLPELVDIAVAKERLEEIVRIRGFVVAATGEVGSGIAYLQDATAGIRIKTEQTLVRGKSYEIQGKIGEAWGETYITAEDVIEVGDVFGIKPIKISPASPNLSQLSTLVNVNGVVTRVSGGSIWIGGSEESTGIIKVYISSSVDWERPEWILKGARISATGVLSQWGYTDQGEPNLRILPRSEKDLVALDKNGKVLGAASTVLPETFGGLSVIPGIVGLGSGLLAKLGTKIAKVKGLRKQGLKRLFRLKKRPRT